MKAARVWSHLKDSLKPFIKKNYFKLIILLVVLVLALVSGAVYFQFDKIVASQKKARTIAREAKKTKENKQKTAQAKSEKKPATEGKEEESSGSETIERPASVPQSKNTEESEPGAQLGKTSDSTSSSQPNTQPSESKEVKPQTEESPASPQKETIEVELLIEYGTKKTYSMEVPAGSTVYDLLKEASSKHNFSLDASNDSSYGAFIEEIGGVRNDPKAGKYWLYYLNGKLANLGASSQKLSAGDKVLWKYEKTL